MLRKNLIKLEELLILYLETCPITEQWTVTSVLKKITAKLKKL